jgi:hypothetical protein
VNKYSHPALFGPGPSCTFGDPLYRQNPKARRRHHAEHFARELYILYLYIMPADAEMQNAKCNIIRIRMIDKNDKRLKRPLDLD